MKTRRPLWILTIVLPAAFAGGAYAQENINLEKGLNPYGSYEGGNLDSVSMTSGNLVLHTPLVSYPQRGGKLSMGFFVRYNNKGWRIIRTGYYPGGAVWTFENKGIEVVRDQGLAVEMESVFYQPSGSSNSRWIRFYKAHSADGSSHYIGSYSDGYGTFHAAADGSGIAPLASPGFYPNGFTVADRSGIRYDRLAISGEPWPNIVSSEDPNGNKITATTSGWTDTLGRFIPKPTVTTDHSGCLSGTAEAKVWNLPGPNGGTSTTKLCYANFQIDSNFQYWDASTGGPAQEVHTTLKLLREIVLPNGTKWSFNYNSYGDLTYVGFPTGGSISYTWATKNVCFTSSAPVSRFVVARQLDANDGTGVKTWTYTWDEGHSGPTEHKVTDPAGNETRYSPDGTSCAFVAESKREYFQGPVGSGNLLKTVETAYQIGGAPTWGLDVGGPSFLPIAVKTIWPNGKISETETAYDSGVSHTFYNYTSFNWTEHEFTNLPSQWSIPLGSTISQTERDYGSGSSGPVLRKVVTDFMWQTNGDYLASNLLDLPSLVRIQAFNQSGILEDMAKTQYGYDLGSPIPSGITTQLNTNVTPPRKRGNLTSVSRWLKSDNTFINSMTTYHDTGTPSQMSDPGGHTTSYTYSSSFAGAYVTQTQFPTTSSPNTSQHIVSGNYDLNTGLLTSFTDQNSHTTNYTYDNMRRITSATFPAQSAGIGQTVFSYPDAVSVRRQEKIDATRWTDLYVKFDGLGREVRRISANDEATPWDQIDTCYDPRGFVGFKSYPYQATGLGAPQVCSGAGDSFTYDALGRLTQIAHSDASTVLTDYTGQATRLRDEGNGTARVERISQVDALGRVTSVCEVTGTSLIGITGTPTPCNQDIGATGFLTTHAYDALGNLTAVAQGGLNSRTFEYDSLSRLTRAVSPEGGTTQYSYDTDGNLIQRVSPAPNQSNPAMTVTTTLQYDELHRLRSKSYSDGTPTVAVNYDQASAFGLSLTNTTGRKSSEFTSLGATTQTGAAFSYDPLGRVLNNSQCTPQNCATGAFPITYSYDLLGQMLSGTNGMGVTLSSAYNRAGRMTSLSSSLADSAHPSTLLSAVHYNAYGRVTGQAFGDGSTHSLSFTGRGWLQNSGVTKPGPPTPGTGSATISGLEQYNSGSSATPGTGSAAVSGSLQSIGGTSATPGTGSATVSGSEQVRPAAPGTGTVTITGSPQGGYVENTYWGCVLWWEEGVCWEEGWVTEWEWVDDSGSVTVVVNAKAKSVSYGGASSGNSLAIALRNAMNADGTYPVTAAVSGNVLYLTSRTNGAATNYPLSAYSWSSYPETFDPPSFVPVTSGGNLTGGVDTLYDAGSAWVTVNGSQKTVTYGQGSTNTSVATVLRDAINADGGYPVSASLSGSTLTLTARTSGVSTNYSLSKGSSTNYGSVFSSPSFSVSTSGPSLTGGTDGTPTVYDSGSVWVTVNGSQKTVTYGQGSTNTSVATVLRDAINADGGYPVSASLSGSTLTLTARTSGVSTNYSLSGGSSTSQPGSFSQPSFAISVSGGNLTGGSDGTPGTYDSGSVWVTVNGSTKTVTYGQGSTSASVASALNTAINNDGSYPVGSSLSGSTLTFTAKTAGVSTNYSLSKGSATDYPALFAQPSFNVAISGPTLTGGSDSGGPVSVYSFSITHAPNGNVLSVNDSVNGNWSYGYDAFNRLASASKTGANYTYEYDRFGNRWHQNALSGGWASHYSFDANNRVAVGQGMTYDAAGNVRTYNDGVRTWTYTYDAESRLISIDNGATASYVYDAAGRRVRRTTSSGSVDYLYDLSGHAITELSAAGGWNRGEIYAGALHVATYSNSTTYFAHVDWLGTERARTGLNSATPVQTCTSLPFGDAISCAGTAASPLHFTGKEHDSESGLDYFGARYHAGLVGRFTVPDPLISSGTVSNPQTWNRYAYVLNNPLALVDPNGLQQGPPPQGTVPPAQNCNQSGAVCPTADAATAQSNARPGSIKAVYNKLKDWLFGENPPPSQTATSVPPNPQVDPTDVQAKAVVVASEEINSAVDKVDVSGSVSLGPVTFDTSDGPSQNVVPELGASLNISVNAPESEDTAAQVSVGTSQHTSVSTSIRTDGTRQGVGVSVGAGVALLSVQVQTRKLPAITPAPISCVRFGARCR